MGLVHAVHQHGEVRLAAGEHLAEAAEAFGSHTAGRAWKGGSAIYSPTSAPGAPPLLARSALEEILARRSAALRFIAVSAAALAAGDCDRLPDAVVLPEFEFAYSFETALEGWTPASADMGSGSWSADSSAERATVGTRSLRLSLANPGGAGKVWLTRELEVTPGKRYAVELTFDLATSDHIAADAWKIIVGARASLPAGASALDFQGDTSSGTATTTGTIWVKKRFTLTAQTDDEGVLYLTVGIWGTTPGSRAYWVDDVQAVLTRTD